MPARPSDSSAITRRRFTTSDGVALSLLEAGDAAGSPVVCFVPGWTMPASLWSAQLASLSHRFRAVAMDPRGQGESEVPASGYDIDRRADDVAEVLAACARVSHSPVVVVGWSLGALEVLHCIARHGAGDIAGVVLVDSSIGLDPSLRQSSVFRDALALDRRATMRQFLCEIVRKPWSAHELARLEEAVLRMPLEASLALFPTRLPREHWRDTALSLAAPLLYAVTLQYAGQAESLLERRPGTRVEIFEDARHALFLDEPERFTRMLLTFVETAAGTR